MNGRTLTMVLGGSAGIALAWACSGEIVDTIYFNQPYIDWGRPPARFTISYWEERNWRASANVNPNFDSSDEQWQREDRASKADPQFWDAVARQNWRGAATVAKAQFDVTQGKIERFRLRYEVASAAVAKSSNNWAPFFSALKKEEQTPGSALPQLQRLSTGVTAPWATYLAAAATPDAAASYRLYLKASKLTGPRAIPSTVMAARRAMEAAFPDGETPKASNANFAREATELFAKVAANPNAKRFHFNARHWLVRPVFMRRKYDRAAASYLRLSAEAQSNSDHISALASFRMAFNRMNAEQAAKFRTAILESSKLSEAYLEYRLDRVPFDWEAPGKPNPALPSIAAFAKLVENKFGKLDPSLTARLAELAYDQGEFARAGALVKDVQKGKNADLADYIRASVADRDGNSDAALEILGRFEANHPNSYLKPAAAEYRAALHIRRNELAKALDEFFRLEFGYDVAYLLDVRMTTEQVKEYLAQNRESKRTDLLRLALGYRQLRDRDYDAAIATFNQIDNARRKKLAEVGRDYAWLQDEDNPMLDRIDDPLGTAMLLKTLEKRVAESAGNAKAAAMYELASAFYNRRNLLLYNASLWKGGRSVLSGLNTGVTTDADQQAIRAHSFQHECLARARELCLTIIANHADSPIAPKATYRAATSARRLADFNPWWRSQPDVKGFYNVAADHLKALYEKYPNDPLAKNARKYEPVFREEGKQAEDNGRWASEFASPKN